MIDPDYTGPIFHTDNITRASYLTLDNTQVVARTETLERGNYAIGLTLMIDYAENGDVLGIEVLW